jgi:hypothetical protein
MLGGNKKIILYDVTVLALPPPGPKRKEVPVKVVNNRAVSRAAWLKFMEIYRNQDAVVGAAYDGQSLMYAVEPGLKEIGPQMASIL